MPESPTATAAPGRSRLWIVSASSRRASARAFNFSTFFRIFSTPLRGFARASHTVPATMPARSSAAIAAGAPGIRSRSSAAAARITASGTTGMKKRWNCATDFETSQSIAK